MNVPGISGYCSHSSVPFVVLHHSERVHPSFETLAFDVCIGSVIHLETYVLNTLTTSSDAMDAAWKLVRRCISLLQGPDLVARFLPQATRHARK